MGSVIKGNRYRLIDNRSFELPLPIKYELLKGNDLIALYEVSEDEKVAFSIITKYKENMITPIYRQLEIADIYYFFSSRVFQNGTPYTAFELQLMGLEKYNVYDIIRKTRGVTPYDTYWLRFEGDDCDYDAARGAWEELITKVPSAEKPEPDPKAMREPDAFTSFPPGTVPFVATSDKTLDSKEEEHVSDILNQHTVNFADRLAEETAELAEAEEIKSKSVENHTMSMDEIDALLMSSGLGAELGMPEEKPAPAEEPKSGGGMMSQADIEKMLAAASAPEPEAAPAPAEEPKSSGGKMSQEDIEKMLAAASAPEPEAAPAPAEEPKSSGGKMSQEDIEKMLAAASAPEPEAAPAPAEEPKSSGGKMSQEDIEKMLAAAAAPEPEAAPAPAEEPKSGGGKMSQDDIEALLNGMKDDAGQ